MGKKQNRVLLFKRVFEELFHESDDSLFFEDLEEVVDEDAIDTINADFLELNSKKDELLSIISNASSENDIERIFKVDLAILLVATFELKYRPETPFKVVVNEAVNIAKRYSTDKSYAYVNGVLAKIINN